MPITKEGAVSLAESEVDGLRARLRGPLLAPGDSGYDAARRVWNTMIDRRPALIARCLGVGDVMSAVDFARANGLIASVRGGGHNIPGNAVCDGGLMIDLSLMKSIRVDPARRTARAEPGVLWAELDHETQAFGLATVGGTVSDTGISGLTLGGGIGWLGGKHGLTADNLLSVDIVTANGQFLTASASEHAGLFWGLRGGGGNFGVVTSFEYQLHPLGMLLAGMVVYPRDRAKELLQFHREYIKSTPDELNTIVALTISPDGAPVIAIAVCYNGDMADGEKALRPLRAFGSPLSDGIKPMSYHEVQTMLDAASPPGRRNYIKTGFLQQISDGAIDTVLERILTAPSPHTFSYFTQLGRAVARADATSTAFSHRDALCEWGCLSVWLDPVEDEVNVRWTRALAKAMEPYTSGAYVNQMEADEATASMKAAYGPTYERLRGLKREYDPTNMFRLNPNVGPTT